MYKFLVFIFIFNFQYIAQAQLPQTDIFLYQLKNDTLIFKQNCTNRKGYDNQPYFDASGNGFYFSAIVDTQADVFYYHFQKNKTYQITKTEEAEYSPRQLLHNNSIYVVRVEKDGKTQNLYTYDTNGRPVQKLAGDHDTIGYYEMINSGTFLFFIIENNKHNLYIYNLNTLKKKEVAKNIGRCIKFYNNKIYYVDKSNSTQFELKCKTKKRTNTLAKLPKNTEDFVCINNNEIMYSDGSLIYKLNTKTKKVTTLITDQKIRLNNIKRMSYNENTNELLLVADDVVD